MLTLDNAKIVKRVNPSKAAKTDGYTYYTPKTKKDLLVDVKLTVKNLQQVTSPSSSFTGAVAVCDGIVHDGFVVAETAGGKDLKSSVKVNPGKEATVRALINVPKEWKGKDISIYLYFDGQEYQYILSGSSK